LARLKSSPFKANGAANPLAATNAKASKPPATVGRP
jgi:hypothetical protein